MAQNFKPKAPKATAKAKTAKTPAKAGGKTDGLRALREKAVAEKPAVQVSATGQINLGALKTIEEFKHAGGLIWRRTIDSILDMSRMLEFAHDKLSKEEHSALLRHFAISDSTALQMRKISSTPRIAGLIESGTHLPASAHTLYLLATLSDDEFKDFSSQHDVDPDLHVEDIRKWKQDRKAPRAISPPTTTKQATDEAKREAAGDLTAPPPPADGEGGPLITDATYRELDQTTGEQAAEVPENGTGSPSIPAESPLFKVERANSAVEALVQAELLGVGEHGLRTIEGHLGDMLRHLNVLLKAVENKIFETAA